MRKGSPEDMQDNWARWGPCQGRPLTAAGSSEGYWDFHQHCSALQVPEQQEHTIESTLVGDQGAQTAERELKQTGD